MTILGTNLQLREQKSYYKNLKSKRILNEQAGENDYPTQAGKARHKWTWT